MEKDSPVYTHGDWRDPHHFIESFSWGQCKKCTFQHACLLFVLLNFKSSQRLSCLTFSQKGCSIHPFIWLSGKGFYSQMLFCSQKRLYKREPFNLLYIFPGYQSFIYFFQWLRCTYTISVLDTSKAQIQFRGKNWLLLPIVCWSLSLCAYSSLTV